MFAVCRESRKDVMTKHLNILNLPESERPYEKFLTRGEEALSDAELLSIILKTGTSQMTATEVATELLRKKQNNLLNLYDYSYEELLEFPGIGKVKAIQLKAVAELSRRIARTSRFSHIHMTNPASIADYYMEQMRHHKKEALMAAFFDAKCNFLGDALISVGSTGYAYVSPKDIFRKALQHNATQIVILHNHPSGDPSPSMDDVQVTERLKNAAEILGLTLADHIIIGDNRFYSFYDNQLI